MKTSIPASIQTSIHTSIEGYFLANLLMDVLLLAAVARSRGRVRWRRVLLGGFGAALYAVLAQFPPLAALRWPLLQPLPALALSCLALRGSTLREVLTGAGLLWAGAVFLGGAQLLAAWTGLSPLPALLVSAGGGVSALAALLGARRRRLVTWEVELCAVTCHGRARFRAMVDTGNRLHEPLSGLPVLIAEARLLRPLLPPEYSAASKAMPAGWRAVAYGALGGAGRLPCFLPDALYVDAGQGFVPAPDVWIAVFPGRISRTVGALAPPILGCEARRRSCFLSACNRHMRRYILWHSRHFVRRSSAS